MNDVETVDVPGLKTLLDRHPGIKLLTVDCFDTLVWRRVWKSSGVLDDVELRRKAEAEARVLNAIRSGTLASYHGSTEVTLEQIHGRDHHNRAADERSREHKYCYVAEPVMALVLEAEHRGITIAVVSDTFHSAEFLGRLIRKIDLRIFASCEHGRSKADGLFLHVLEQFGRSRAPIDASEVLHLGDSYAADYLPAKAAGMRAVLFTPRSAKVLERERCGVAAAKILDEPSPVFSTFKPALASRPLEDSAMVIGRTFLGPLLAAFCRYLDDDTRPEFDETLFVLRDGWLLQRAMERHDSDTKYDTNYRAVAVSRFTAVAQSLTDVVGIERYLVNRLRAGAKTEAELRATGRQLLLNDEEISELVATALASEMPGVSFARHVVRWFPKRIQERAQAFNVRMHRHLNLNPHHRATLVDLGYAGTAFELLKDCYPNLGRRYLLSLGVGGLLDRSTLRADSLNTLARYVAPLELLCSCPNIGSVVDYQEDGDPIFAVLPPELVAQHERLAPIRKHALDFVEEVRVEKLSVEEVRQTALQALGAFLLLPGGVELQFFRELFFDVNLGTDKVVKLVDYERAERRLRSEGLAYFGKGHGSGPLELAELRAVGSSGLDFLTMVSRNLELAEEDVSARAMRVSAAFDDAPPRVLEARATFDGFFALELPDLDPPAERVELTFGSAVSALQVASVSGTESFMSSPVGLALRKPRRARVVFRPARGKSK